ncbi:hypothetical protein [Pseudanabaena sp. FACHB-2040]|uniref:hypothetical protein n=1 Tax=Pseudanabaena sp. FACHB-2040 TaxID=2692859 RepID=UPI001689D73C|nr:hypothetical protein [Pseudanabaena sp. FACHB-2040]MBD2259010.1 hypothetical protein [Pseudanabaena sp. FACHB-2040]
MTLPSPDQRLSEFLRQHRPSPPAADPTLEDQLMASLSTSQQVTSSSHLPRRLWSRQLGISALLASCLLAYATVRFSRQPQVAEIDQEDLELFVAETWGGSAYSDIPTLEASAADASWLLTMYADSPLD